jgi:hypothetical protein
MLAVPSRVRKYCYPARVKQRRRGLMVLRNTRPLSGQDGFGERYIITVAYVEGDVRSPGIRSDNINIAEAPLEDFHSDGFKSVKVLRVAHKCGDIKIGEGPDEVSKHGT